MLTEHELFAVFLGRAAHVAGNEMYFEPEVAIQFLAACEENNLAVIGIEGFIFDDPALMPQVDLIADYSASGEKSWRSFRDSCNRDAAHFLQQLPQRQNLVLSLTVLSGKEWKKN